MGKLAFVFPGQGAQAAGMGRELCEAFPAARAVFEAIDAALNEPLSRLCFEGPEEQLRLTANTQPAILAVSAAAAAVLAEAGVSPDSGWPLAGRVLGAGGRQAVTPADAARAVRARGTFMQEAVPAGKGAMAAVLGLPPERVREVCAAVALATGQVCSPANYNEPSQTVIAGEAGAVERATSELKVAGARKVVPLSVSAPFHCALMEPVKARLEPVLRRMKLNAPPVPVVTNVEARANSEAARVVPLLVAQVTSPVRWLECVEELVRLGATRVVEVGPGKVLSGLVSASPGPWRS